MDIRSINPEIEFDSMCKAGMVRNGDTSILAEFKKAIARAKKEGKLETRSGSTKKVTHKPEKNKSTRKLVPLSEVSITRPRLKIARAPRGWH